MSDYKVNEKTYYFAKLDDIPLKCMEILSEEGFIRGSFLRVFIGDETLDEELRDWAINEGMSTAEEYIMIDTGD